MFATLIPGLAAGVVITLNDIRGGSYVKSGAGGGLRSISLTLNTDGTLVINGNPAGATNLNYAKPTTAGIGNQVYVKFTPTVNFDALSDGSYTAATGVLALSAARQVVVSSSGFTGSDISVSYLIQLYSDAAGTVLIDSCTTTLEADHL